MTVNIQADPVPLRGQREREVRVGLESRESVRRVERSRPSEFPARLLGLVEFIAVRIRGSIFGVESVVRYLRNPNPRITIKVLRAFGATIGERTKMKGSVFIDNVLGDANATGDFRHLHIADNCYIGDCVFFDLAGEIFIENNSVVAGRVSFLTHSECGRSPVLSKAFPRKCAPVEIGSGAWLGFGSTVLAGVRMGENSALGANSLLLSDAERNWVYVGSPAKRTKPIE